MADPSLDHDNSHEVDFDVSKPPEGIAFVGLLEPCGESGNRLNGLFDWRCPGCGAGNRDIALVELQQAFLARWSCNRCAETTVVRFRGRASADWIAGHALAITGSALCHLADEEYAAECPTANERGGQRIFAWIAIPALLVLIVLGISNIRRPSDSSAAPAWMNQKLDRSEALSRLLGTWSSEEGDDLLCFVRVDADLLTGTYVRFPGGRLPGLRVRFDVIHEDPAGERLVIRQWPDDLDGAQDGLPRETTKSDATIYIPAHGRSLTWIDVEGGEPVLKVLRRVENEPADLSDAL